MLLSHHPEIQKNYDVTIFVLVLPNDTEASITIVMGVSRWQPGKKYFASYSLSHQVFAMLKNILISIPWDNIHAFASIAQ